MTDRPEPGKPPSDLFGAGRSSGRRLTLGHIAEQLGISTATVSLALRDSPLVAEDTRSKVKETAERIGYIYNRSAASLRTARSQIVGVAVHDILNPYFAEIFSALESVLEAEGQMIFICNHKDEVNRQRAFVTTLLQHRADGLIICPSVGTTADEINRLCDQGIPVTLVCREVEGAKAPCVRGDDLAGGYAVARHLVEQGHRAIAMLGGRRSSSSGRDRHAGWRKALEEAGIDPNAQLDLPELMTQADGRNSVERILQAKVRPTAVMCFNDLIALGAMPMLSRAGLEPGRDIAITGYDDVDGAANSMPTLTSVCNHASKIGRLAAHTLLGLIAGDPEVNKLVLVEPELRIRESSILDAEASRSRLGRGSKRS